MHLDPNSLFESVGLHELTFEKPQRLLSTLEIQVSEDEVCRLEVREYDDPYLVAFDFCTQYQLNEIAVDVVKKRVQQILDKQQLLSSNVPTNKKYTKEKQVRRQADRVKETKKKDYVPPHPIGSAIGSRLYQKGVKSLYRTQQYRIQQQMQKQAEDKRQLTFKPKINEVSEKIVEIRKMMGGNPSHPKLKDKNVQKINDEMEQCTFKPTINKQSQRIVNEKFNRGEEDFVEKLYYDSLRLEARKNKRKEAEKQEYSYKPVINEKSRIQVRDTFMERLEKDLQNKKEKHLRTVIQDQHCSFTPEIGRAPKVARNKQNLPIGEYLSSKNYQSRSKSELSRANFKSISDSTITNKNSETIYQNLVKKRIEQLFELLDGNKDGYISPDHIDVEELSCNTLSLLGPFFKEMEELGAVLDQRTFSKAMFKLLDISSHQLKGEFISENWRKQPDNQYSFKPKLNNKSAKIAQSRTGINLYEQGIQARRKKEVYTALLQARKEEQELGQCTFKPLLNSTSQTYMQKHLYRKSYNDDSLQRGEFSEQNEQI